MKISSYDIEKWGCMVPWKYLSPHADLGNSPKDQVKVQKECGVEKETYTHELWCLSEGSRYSFVTK